MRARHSSGAAMAGAADRAVRDERPPALGTGGKAVCHPFLDRGGAVLVTGVLGYLRARDALEASIYNQLTTARKSKARQIETYFRTLHTELSQLAASKMMLEAARGFRAAFDELEQADGPGRNPPKGRRLVRGGLPAAIRRLLGKELDVADYLPGGAAAYYLQYHYIVANPYPRDRRRLVDDAGDGSAWSRAARDPPSAAARRRGRLRVLRRHAGRSAVGPADLLGRQGGRFRHVAAHRPLSILQRLRRRRPLRRRARPRRYASRTSRPTRPRDGAPTPSWRRR